MSMAKAVKWWYDMVLHTKWRHYLQLEDSALEPFVHWRLCNYALHKSTIDIDNDN